MVEGVVSAYIAARKKYRDRQYHGEFQCKDCPEAFACGWDAALKYAQELLKEMTK